MTIANNPVAANISPAPKKLAVLATFEKGLPMEEAIRKASEAGLTIASNRRIDQALMSTSDFSHFANAFPLWTGTLIIHEDYGVPLGKTFEIREWMTKHRYVVEIPEEHQGKKNVLLAASHPDFTIEREGNNRIIIANKLDAITEVPFNESDWLLGDATHGIPSGSPVDRNDMSARYLISGYRGVRLVVRGHDDFGFVNPYEVCINSRPSNEYGVVVEGTPEQISAAAGLIGQMKVK